MRNAERCLYFRCVLGALCAFAFLAGARAGERPRLGWDDFVEDVKDGLENKANEYIDLVDNLGGDETAEDLRDSLDDLRNGDKEKNDTPAAPAYVAPALQLRLEHNTLSLFSVLDLYISARGGQGVFDVYLAVQTFDGPIVCLDAQGAPFLEAVPYAAAWTATEIVDAPLLTKILPRNLAPGEYRVAVICVPTGANPHAPANWASLSDAPFTVEE